MMARTPSELPLVLILATIGLSCQMHEYLIARRFSMPP